jgi:hypothetical protein
MPTMPSTPCHQPALTTARTFLVAGLLALAANAPAAVTINEFLAINDRSSVDDQGKASDWIELYNDGASAVSLNGWHLTDDAAALTKWTFPNVSIPAKSYLVVRASGDDLRDPTKPLHTSFKLSGDGEYLALVNANGTTIADQISPAYPGQRPDVSYGRSNGWKYFATPTPGAANGAGAIGFISDLTASVQSGLFTQTQSLTLSTATSGCTIRYTTNGSRPTATNGSVYSGAIAISTTTVIRAAAFRTDYIPTAIASRSYIFPAAVVTQRARANGTPRPQPWTGSDFNRGQSWLTTAVNSGVVNTYGSDNVIAGLRDLPSLSLIGDPKELFDRNQGIMANAGVGKLITVADPLGTDWERAISSEFILADGSPGFRLDAGLVCAGRISRLGYKFPMNLEFRSRYGADTLDYPLFPESPITAFGDLRLQPMYASEYHASRMWVNDLQQAMTGARSSQSSRFIHLYINGIYWGLYAIAEKANDEFCANHFGGKQDDYVAGRQRKGISEADRDLNSPNPWIRFLSQTSFGSPADFQTMKAQLDMNHYADYAILVAFLAHFRSKDEDRWGWSGVQNQPWRAFPWDVESLTYVANGQDVLPLWPGNSYVHHFDSLLVNSDFRAVLADRLQKHFVNANGVLNKAQLSTRFDARVNQTARAVFADAARWWDEVQRREKEISRTKAWMPVQSDRTLALFVDAGYFMPGPTFSDNRATLPRGTKISLLDATLKDGALIYYTTNGNDPRAAATTSSPEGGLNTGARKFRRSITINAGATIKTRSLVNGKWSAMTTITYAVTTTTTNG